MLTCINNEALKKWKSVGCGPLPERSLQLDHDAAIDSDTRGEFITPAIARARLNGGRAQCSSALCARFQAARHALALADEDGAERTGAEVFQHEQPDRR